MENRVHEVENPSNGFLATIHWVCLRCQSTELQYTSTQRIARHIEYQENNSQKV